MPTIKDVAKLASVSTATVSAVLNGTAYVSPQLKDRVERAVAELGYTTDGVARSLKKGVTNLIGLIVDDTTAPFYMSLVEEISSAAFAKGFSVLLCPTGRDAATERKYLSLLRSHRVGGIIWSPTGRAEDYPVSRVPEVLDADRFRRPRRSDLQFLRQRAPQQPRRRPAGHQLSPRPRASPHRPDRRRRLSSSRRASGARDMRRPFADAA